MHPITLTREIQELPPKYAGLAELLERAQAGETTGELVNALRGWGPPATRAACPAPSGPAGQAAVQGALVALLGLPQPVSVAVALILGEQPLDDTTRHEILGLLMAKRSGRRHTAMYILLMHREEPGVIDAFMQLVRTDRDPGMRLYAAVGLQDELERPDVVSLLLGALLDRDASARLRRTAALNLGPVASIPQVRAALLASLRDPKPLVRWAATQALGPFAADPDIAAALCWRLWDPSRRVHRALVPILHEQIDQSIVQLALLSRLADANDALAQRILSEPVIRARLLALVRDEKPKVRAAAKARWDRISTAAPDEPGGLRQLPTCRDAA